ncbi:MULTISPECIES: SDR family oxidoreductase [Haloprofundus]|uniref:SDR family oxidoreductase n=1 Tax=Haloprofundus TaxID=1911573 RepID=UPI000E444895|nr:MULTISPECIES: SDR family oxidoreductase [Haloprofundus]QCJ48011.1 SDR family NAD(P)-dependent oxidoreductase [Haloprofundus sp. MHR1]
MTDKPLDGRVAFITGTSRGIGKALALAFADAGAAVVSTGKTMDEHERLPGTVTQTTEEIRERGGDSIALQLDVRDESNVESAIEETVDEFGGIDLVVNNAGAIQFGGVDDIPAKRFDLLMDVNARGAYVTTRAALPYLRESDHAHVVMNSPPTTMEPAPGKAAYALSKYGMTFLARSLADELRSDEVAVNSVWPVSAIETEATRHFELGRPEDWRKPQVVVDAMLELVTRDPTECTGNEFYDEELLREAGVSEFARYAVVDGADPGPTSAQLFDSRYGQSE